MAGDGLRPSRLRLHDAPRDSRRHSHRLWLPPVPLGLLHQPSPESPVSSQPGVNFDAFASGYDQALERGIAASGEGRDYFAEGRVSFLADCLRARSFLPTRVMDFGCGTGATAPFLFQSLRPEFLLG